ncbi:MAG: Asp-tRNA(Asn)/Glu-tRNA(Gln) amidotransferase subunit GatB [Candidatus Aenigmarchaeota archaeon]|nr:Asp-tRNA(Asn)/Glu-tRNA(Gln) amidotransferase subunit GatB [Candidatus Aenigmarchaeota archaeon]
MKIGLEVHVALTTETKLFCGCPNKVVKEPNTETCEYCIGLPGSKPQLNAKAVECGIKIGLALNCKFPPEMFFSRKSYFYPDMGKNFQITQYEIPIASGGVMHVNKKPIRITRINLEEDPARIVHVGTITKAEYVLLDYNRSGVPLCEIVTAPDFAGTKEVRNFLQELSSILEYLGVYDPNIEGSMRIDANISVAETRVEVKNISGFRDVEKALSYEIVRQQNMVRLGEQIVRETRGWDAVSGVTRSLRAKEGEEDYGYIFESDLPRIVLEKGKIGHIRKQLPELAAQKIRRYQRMGIAEELAVAITTEPSLADMFERVSREVDTQLAARWFAGEIKKTLNYSNLRMKETGMKPEYLVKLLKFIETGKLTERTAEIMLREIVKRPEDPEAILKGKDIVRIVDETALMEMIKAVLNENAQAIIDYKSGKKEAFNFLVGQVMKKSQGRGDPETIRKLLRSKL